MITCSDCVRELKTARLSDIRAGSPVALHYASCENCSRLVHDLYYSERRLATALDTFGPDASSPVVAENATEAMYRRRKKIARAVRVLLAAAGLIVTGIGIAIITDDGSSWQGEIIELKCLSGAEASRIAEGFMTSGGNIRLEAGERTIVLEGTMSEVVEAASQIAVADASGKCAIGPGGSGTTTPPGDKPGTD